MTYDPLAVPKISDAVLERHFGPNSVPKLAAALHRDNPTLYDQMRVLAEEKGLVGPRSYFRPTDIPAKQGKKEPSPAEQVAMSEFSAEDCAAYFKTPTGQLGAKNAAKLREQDPAAYDRLKVAARARGVLPEQPAVEIRDARKPHKPAPTPSDGRFQLAPDMCIEAGLPLDTKGTLEEFGKISQQIASNRRQRPNPKPADEKKQVA